MAVGDVWGNRWLAAWGASWGQAAAPSAQPEQPPGGGFFGGFKHKDRKRNRVIRYSDFESREAYAKELAAAALPLTSVPDPSLPVMADDEDDDIIALLLTRLH